MSLLVPHPGRASGIAYVIPFAIDPYGGVPAEQDAFYGSQSGGNGQVGVLMGRAPWSRLFGAWRILHGQVVGQEAGKTLAIPCCDAPATGIAKPWLEARKAVPGAVAIDDLDVYRSLPDYVAIQTCFADAFTTAARTLQDRVAAHGATDPFVKAWLDGQDTVFASCSETPPMPDLPAAAPAWLAQDRAYQAAAQALYERDFPTATAAFMAIGGDAASPWQPRAAYLAARSALAGAIASPDPAAFAAARQRIADLPPASPDASGLSSALDFRARPNERRAELITTLSAATLPGSVAADFKDLRRLGQQPAGTPEFLDWITVFGRQPDKPGDTFWFDHYRHDDPWKTDADALAHARARWSATHDTAWLLAALAWSSPGAAADDLVAAAAALPRSDPGWLTATYHRFRLATPANPVAARQTLDAALALPGFASSRNLLVAERAMLAGDAADWLRFARRDAPCVSDYAGPIPSVCVGWQFKVEDYAPAAPGGRFGDDALAGIDRMTLPQRAALAENTALSAPLRLDIALTTWTRAALMQDWPMTDRLARDLVPLLPAMAPDMNAVIAAAPGAGKRIAAWFALAKMPGAAIDNGPLPFNDPAFDWLYTRPVGPISSFDGHWPDWRYLPPDAVAAPVLVPAPPADIVCFGLCGGGTFPYHPPAFIADQAALAARERGHYAPVKSIEGAGDVWEDLLTFARTHPDDPRSPEALYWLVRISRYGHGHNRSSFRAYTLLHSRYKRSEWARRTPYFYD